MRIVLTYLAAGLGGLASSACCWIPALLGGGAAGALGASAALAPYRPYLLALTAVFLALGFYLAYRRSPAECASKCCATPNSRVKRRVRIGTMWAVALIAVGSAAYPYLAGSMHSAAGGALSATPSKQISIAVSGIDCPTCAIPIEKRLRNVPGVVDAKLDYRRSVVTVALSEPTNNTERLIKTIREIGFEAKLVDPTPGSSLQQTQHEPPVALALRLEGVTCSGCVSAVRTALTRVRGVTDVSVDFESKMAHLKIDSCCTAVQESRGRKNRATGQSRAGSRRTHAGW